MEFFLKQIYYDKMEWVSRYNILLKKINKRTFLKLTKRIYKAIKIILLKVAWVKQGMDLEVYL